ncbi:MAG TPA: acetyltransferase [Noviherbaspirillum sp.]|nr:acetyltransferase [Noviherbaspirillum sp.]
MAHFDVFNGDADGICALHQLRLEDPRASDLITGVKRDIALLGRVPAQAGDAVTVLDISIDVNRAPLLALLQRGVSILYFDHHGSGQVTPHPALDAHIEPLPGTCTSTLVDRWLGGRRRPWAVVGAFGDNMGATARALAATLWLDEGRTERLRVLGEALNYNGYGDSIEDLMIHPAELYRLLHAHTDPFGFIENEPICAKLVAGRQADMAAAHGTAALLERSQGRIVVLPDAAWSRRVRGSYGNELAVAQPQRAHAVLSPDRAGGYVVSVRAPIDRPVGADALCQRFPGGGGRPAAAGINHLPADRLDAFARAFEQAFCA